MQHFILYELKHFHQFHSLAIFHSFASITDRRSHNTLVPYFIAAINGPLSTDRWATYDPSLNHQIISSSLFVGTIAPAADLTQQATSVVRVVRSHQGFNRSWVALLFSRDRWWSSLHITDRRLCLWCDDLMWRAHTLCFVLWTTDKKDTGQDDDHVEVHIYMDLQENNAFNKRIKVI